MPKDTNPHQDAAFDPAGAFPRPDLQEWREEAERLLRGAPFAKKLFTRTLEGIEIGPLYTDRDTADLSWRDSLPGQAPFVRGAKAGGYRAAPWEVAQELPLPAPADFNQALCEDLQRGQTTVHLVLDEAGRAGRDADAADPGQVGRGGTSVGSLADLETALDRVSLGRVPLLTNAGAGTYALAALVLAHLDKQEIRHDGLGGCLGFDPAAELARTGSLSQGVDGAYAQLAELTRWAMAGSPDLRTLTADEDVWHDGGADAALGLGCTLAAAVEQLRRAEAAGIDPDEAAGRLQFRVQIGSDFFMEIAKLRALRLLWHDVLQAAGCAGAAARIRIHARTSRRTASRLDAHANLLRSTTQAMSAVLGGVDSLHVARFDEIDSLPDEFGRRIARNQQLLLAHECHFDHIGDPAGGSWYVEKLTADLADRAWRQLQAIEAEDGLVAAIRNGFVQQRVAETADRRAADLAVRKQVLVGVNQYANLEEAARARRDTDPDFAAERAAAATRSRGADRGRHFAETVGRIEETSGMPALAALAEAALHGATLGELAGWAAAGGEPAAAPAVPPRREAEPFEELRERTSRLQAADESTGRVFCACLGDFARYMPRLDFVRRFFAVGGFVTAADAFFTTPTEAARAAAGSGAGTVVLVGLDETYAETAVETARQLAASGPPPRLYLAGQPGELEADLAGLGVEFLHVRSDVLQTLHALIDHLGGEEVAR